MGETEPFNGLIKRLKTEENTFLNSLKHSVLKSKNYILMQYVFDADAM